MKNKNYEILRSESLYARNRYIIRKNPGCDLSDEKLIEALDGIFAAPFGGRVESNGDGTYTVDVYTD